MRLATGTSKATAFSEPVAPLPGVVGGQRTDGDEPARLAPVRTAGEQHLEAQRPVEQDLLQAGFAVEDVAQRLLRVQPEHHVDVGQPEVGVEQQHARARLAESEAQVHGDQRLADAALAPGHGDHAAVVRAAANVAQLALRGGGPEAVGLVGRHRIFPCSIHAWMKPGWAARMSSGTLWPTVK